MGLLIGMITRTAPMILVLEIKGELAIAKKVETAAMIGSDAELADGLAVATGGVALV